MKPRLSVNRQDPRIGAIRRSTPASLTRPEVAAPEWLGLVPTPEHARRPAPHEGTVGNVGLRVLGARCNQLQVLDPIVRLDAVAVMHDLLSEKRSPEVDLHDRPVFIHAPAPPKAFGERVIERSNRDVPAASGAPNPQRMCGPGWVLALHGLVHRDPDRALPLGLARCRTGHAPLRRAHPAPTKDRRRLVATYRALVHLDLHSECIAISIYPPYRTQHNA